MIDRTFIDELASGNATPGGGAASAYCGALACALATMVANFTVGRDRYADVEADVLVMLEKLQDSCDELIQLVEADSHAFEPVARAYRMPKATPEEQAARTDAVQVALGGACEVPLSIMETSIGILDAVDFLAHRGNVSVRSDAVAAAIMVRASVQSASLNVFVNAHQITDHEMADKLTTRAKSVVDMANDQVEQIVSFYIETVK